MAYTTVDKPGDYFNTIVYEGNEDNSGIQAQTGVGFQPDLVWVKNREGAFGHIWVDSVRGVGQTLTSRSTAAEEDEAGTVEVFGSDGFTVGEASQAAGPAVNQDEKDHVAWCWKCETAFSNDASATSVGSIDSVGKVNTTAGFSIVSYTGTGANATIAHGLGAKPQVIITKSRDTAQNWLVQHKYSIGSDGWTDSLVLNLTNAADDDASYWNDTEPTSTVFSVGSSALSNKSSDAMIAYCFAEKQGYSKFGSYTGNGSTDGTFVYTGFKPAFTLIKRTDSATGGSWILFDNKRGTNVINPVDVVLAASNNQSEADWGTTYDCDYLSNGFKWRFDGTGGYNNASGGTYIYMAFAENPFVTSTGVPATAR